MSKSKSKSLFLKLVDAELRQFEMEKAKAGIEMEKNPKEVAVEALFDAQLEVRLYSSNMLDIHILPHYCLRICPFYRAKWAECSQVPMVHLTQTEVEQKWAFNLTSKNKHLI